MADLGDPFESLPDLPLSSDVCGTASGHDMAHFGLDTTELLSGDALDPTLFALLTPAGPPLMTPQYTRALPQQQQTTPQQPQQLSQAQQPQQLPQQLPQQPQQLQQPQQQSQLRLLPQTSLQQQSFVPQTPQQITQQISQQQQQHQVPQLSPQPCARPPSEASNVTASLPGSPQGSADPLQVPTAPSQRARLVQPRSVQQHLVAPHELHTTPARLAPARPPPADLPLSLRVDLAGLARPTVPGQSVVEYCRKVAEDITNKQVNERKRKAGVIAGSDDDDQGGNGTAKKARASGADESCEEKDGDAAEGSLRPEDVSHRKYQKRLEKNRKSAFVSRIRRREYTRILEESLTQKEAQVNEFASAYNKLRIEYDNMRAEVAALRESISSYANHLSGAVVRNMAPDVTASHPQLQQAPQQPAVGAGSAVGTVATPQHASHGSHGGHASSGTSSTAVVTMFVFALMFGIMLPDIRDSAHASSPGAAAATTLGASGLAMSTGGSVIVDNSGKPLVLTTSGESGSSSALKQERHALVGSQCQSDGQKCTVMQVGSVAMSAAKAGNPALVYGGSVGQTAQAHIKEEQDTSGSPTTSTTVVKEEETVLDPHIEEARRGSSSPAPGSVTSSAPPPPQPSRGKSRMQNKIVSASGTVWETNGESPVQFETHAEGGALAAAIVEDAVSEPSSSCPTMVDVDGDLVVDCEPVTSQGLIAQLEINVTRLLGDTDARRIVSIVKRKVEDGAVSTQTLAIITKNSAVAADLLPEYSKRSSGSEVDVDIAAKPGKDVPSTVDVHQDAGSELSGHQADVMQSPSHKFVELLRRLALVADDRFTAEVGALLAYRLVPSDTGSKITA